MVAPDASGASTTLTTLDAAKAWMRVQITRFGFDPTLIDLDAAVLAWSTAVEWSQGQGANPRVAPSPDDFRTGAAGTTVQVWAAATGRRIRPHAFAWEGSTGLDWLGAFASEPLPTWTPVREPSPELPKVYEVALSADGHGLRREAVPVRRITDSLCIHLAWRGGVYDVPTPASTADLLRDQDQGRTRGRVLVIREVRAGATAFPQATEAEAVEYLRTR